MFDTDAGVRIGAPYTFEEDLLFGGLMLEMLAEDLKASLTATDPGLQLRINMRFVFRRTRPRASST